MLTASYIDTAQHFVPCGIPLTLRHDYFITVHVFPAQDSSAITWSVSPLVSVTEWMWKIHVVGSGQGYEGVFAYEACSDNVEGLHMADGVKWPIVKSFWLEPHLNSILEGSHWYVTKLELGKNKHTAVWWWGKDAGMNHSPVIRWWNSIFWVLMEKNQFTALNETRC